MGINIAKLQVTSPDFSFDERMPEIHAYEQGNRAPELVVGGVPTDAVELALICHDPDAPLPQGFTHWLLYGIPAASTVRIAGGDSSGFSAGVNGFGERGYGGPRPPPGHGMHHYYFWVYALDIHVEGTPSREEFLKRYASHILEQNRLVGRYQTA